MSIHNFRANRLSRNMTKTPIRKLRRLNLGGNKLTSIPQKALAILENLKKLEMQENSIKKIEEGDFAVLYKYASEVYRRNRSEGLRNLDSLGLAHNRLTNVPPRVFSHLSLLNSLELDGNNIEEVDSEAFAGLEGEHKEMFVRLPGCNVITR
ncbi:hypothetical protein NQ317_013644 [Molorchus minor]|uniref:Uncharacterized protein n=1 Tax=Molorchus minor TaxID=1323400 RepID=A0ABQ9JWC4_9CUCU|nr:hypothetical protein NQ317_013644 [Molorchus minor]